MSDTDIKTALDIFIENSLKKCLKSEYISDANIDKFKLNTDKLTNFSSIILTNKYINTEYGKPYLKTKTETETITFDSVDNVIASLNPVAEQPPPTPPKSREELGLPRRQPRWYPVPAEKKTAEELAAAVRRVLFKTTLCGGGTAMRLFMEKKEGVAYTCPGCKDVECEVCYD